MAADQHVRFDATRACGALLDEDCEIPADMTLREWRAACAAERHAAREPRHTLRRRMQHALRRR